MKRAPSEKAYAKSNDTIADFTTLSCIYELPDRRTVEQCVRSITSVRGGISYFTAQGKSLGVFPSFYEITGKSSSPSSMHRHGYLELIIIAYGAGYHRSLRGIEAVSAGDVIFVNDRMPHSLYTRATPLGRINIAFHPSRVEGLNGISLENEHLSEIDALAAFYPSAQRAPYRISLSPTGFSRILCSALQLVHIFYSAVRGADGSFKDDHGAHAALHLQFNTLLHVLFMEHQGGIDKRSPWLRRALSFIEKNYVQPLTVAEIASAANLSGSYLMARFKRAMNVRVTEYINRKRIAASLRMLSETSMSIAEVAFSCGFQSATYFARTFKRTMGADPRTWRMNRHVH